MQYCRSVPDPDRRHRERAGGPVGIDLPWQQRRRIVGFIIKLAIKEPSLTITAVVFTFPSLQMGGTLKFGQPRAAS